jgi:hypothetical protein
MHTIVFAYVETSCLDEAWKEAGRVLADYAGDKRDGYVFNWTAPMGYGNTRLRYGRMPHRAPAKTPTGKQLLLLAENVLNNPVDDDIPRFFHAKSVAPDRYETEVIDDRDYVRDLRKSDRRAVIVPADAKF